MINIDLLLDDYKIIKPRQTLGSSHLAWFYLAYREWEVVYIDNPQHGYQGKSCADIYLGYESEIYLRSEENLQHIYCSKYSKNLKQGK